MKGVSSLKAHPSPIATYHSAPHQAGLCPSSQSGHRVWQRSQGNAAKVREEESPRTPDRAGCLGAHRASLGCVVSCSCRVDKICLRDRHALPACLVTKLDMRETEGRCHSSEAQSRMPWEEPHLGHSQVRRSRRPPELPLAQESFRGRRLWVWIREDAGTSRSSCICTVPTDTFPRAAASDHDFQAASQIRSRFSL